MFSMAVAGLVKSLSRGHDYAESRGGTGSGEHHPPAGPYLVRLSRPAPTAARPTGPPYGGPTTARYPTRT